MIRELSALLEQAVEANSFGAAQAAVWAKGEEQHGSAHGGFAGIPTDEKTLFDVSSLTKVIATATLAYRMLSRGELDLEDRLGHFFPRAAAESVTIGELLAHRSGLPAWRPLFATGPRVLEAALRVAPEGRRGERSYSDLGFILLGAILERVGERPLDRLFDEEVAEPLGLSRTAFRPIPARVRPEGPRLAVAPTGDRRPRRPAPGQEGSYEAGPEVKDAGEVDDDNAFALGGVAGHAGLFSTAAEVARWAEAMHSEREGAGRLGKAVVLERMFAESFGFDRPTGPRSSAGTILGRGGTLGAAGHLGFTGCSVWLDLDRRWSVVLLTNRVYPDRRNEEIREFRPLFHDEAARILLREGR